MARKLWVVANGLSYRVDITSTEHPFDNNSVDPHLAVHTGGKDGNFIRIPDCSDEVYYPDHHLTIRPSASTPVWKITLWSHDGADHLLFWSVKDSFNDSHGIGGSNLFDSCSIFLYQEGADINFNVTPF